MSMDVTLASTAAILMLWRETPAQAPQLPTPAPYCTKHTGKVCDSPEQTPTSSYSDSIHLLLLYRWPYSTFSICLKKKKITSTSQEPGFAGHISSNPVIHFTYVNLFCVDTPDDLLSTGPPVRWPVLVFYPREHWLVALLHARFVLGWHISL